MSNKLYPSVLVFFLGAVFGTQGIYLKGYPKVRYPSEAQYERISYPFLPSRMEIGNPFWRFGQRRTILKEARMQSAIMAEQYLSKSSDSACTQKSFCDVSALSGSMESKKAASSTINVLLQMLNEVTGKETEFPELTGLIAAYTVGAQTKNETLCEWLFPCEELLFKQGRVNCKATATLCPGIAISCGLCAIISPETCGAVCPLAAVYCGTSGYACREPQEEEPMEEAVTENTEPTEVLLQATVPPPANPNPSLSVNLSV